jgi:hypothetical protein
MTTPIETTQSTLTPQTDAAPGGFAFSKAFDETAAERAALQPEDFMHIGFDTTRAVRLVLAAVTRIERLKDEIAELPLDHAFLNRLDLYVHAAGFAQARCNAVHSPPEVLKALYEEAVSYRAMLHSDALNLITHARLSADAVNEIKNETGFYNVGFDLMSLVTLFREAAPRIIGRTATQPADLLRAEQVATELLELAARRDEYERSQPTLREDRLRALTLLIRCYQETRRAVQFVRFHHGDAEQIAPSIYTARKGRKRGEVLDPIDEIAPVATQTSPAPGTEVFPVVPIGAPGGNPFA